MEESQLIQHPLSRDHGTTLGGAMTKQTRPVPSVICLYVVADESVYRAQYRESSNWFNLLSGVHSSAYISSIAHHINWCTIGSANMIPKQTESYRQCTSREKPADCEAFFLATPDTHVMKHRMIIGRERCGYSDKSADGYWLLGLDENQPGKCGTYQLLV